MTDQTQRDHHVDGLGLAPTVVTRIRRRVLGWGRRNYQVYAWRSEHDPWLTLVVEMLLQRTRAAQVESVFHEFRERFPTARRFVEAGEIAASDVTRKLGLHFRAAHIYAVAQATVELGGRPPKRLDKLRTMTGIGPYTAAAWLSLHQGSRAVIVDANIARWLSRLTGLPYERDPRHVHWVNKLADQLTPKRAFRDYNYAVLDFTMLICTVRKPRCDACPLRPMCAYGALTRMRTEPSPRLPKSVRTTGPQRHSGRIDPMTEVS